MWECSGGDLVTARGTKKWRDVSGKVIVRPFVSDGPFGYIYASGAIYDYCS